MPDERRSESSGRPRPAPFRIASSSPEAAETPALFGLFRLSNAEFRAERLGTVHQGAVVGLRSNAVVITLAIIPVLKPR